MVIAIFDTDVVEGDAQADLWEIMNAGRSGARAR